MYNVEYTVGESTVLLFKTNKWLSCLTGFEIYETGIEYNAVIIQFLKR